MYELQLQYDKYFHWIRKSKTFHEQKYQEHCDVIQKLNHAEKCVLATVRINLTRN